jgi:hypothetical protein
MTSRGRAPGLDNYAAVHEDQCIADFTGEPDLVRDDDHGHAFGGQVAHHVEYLTDELWVER